MGNLVPSSRWDDVPYFEANAALTGGPDCPDNLPIQALLNRTEYLKGMVENMSLSFDAVPATNKGLFIVVKQPHTRMMMWNGSQYVRAPWHQPCQLFFSYDNPASIPGALPVRGDVSYQQANYPDLVARLGLSGNGTFTLAEARGEFIRVLDNGRGVDAGRVLGGSQEQQTQAHKHISAIGEAVTGIAAPLFGSSTTKNHRGTNGSIDFDNFLEFTNDGTTYSGASPNSAGVIGAETRPRNLAYPLWITY